MTDSQTTESRIDATKHPHYHLFPWEVEECKRYSKRSVHHFIQRNIITESIKAKKTFDAYYGAAGEYGFYELLKQNNRELIKEWPFKDDNFGSYYDFLVENEGQEYTIDIKTSIKSDGVSSPAECNFIWGTKSAHLKEDFNIKFCDFYIQMWYDPDAWKVYFVGAISINRIKELEESKDWDRRRGYAIIKQDKMDFTDQFLKYFDDKSKVNFDIESTKEI